MTVELFLVLLMIASIATPIGIECVKKFLDAVGATYKSVPLAIIVAIAVGFAEMFIYYSGGEIAVTTTIIYAVILGFANAVGATTSYDLVKKFINALFGKDKQEGLVLYECQIYKLLQILIM